jgi:hypothetical protein
MHADGEPAWLVAWRERDHQQSQAPKQPKPRKPAPPRRSTSDGPLVPLRMRGQAAAIGIVEPEPWPFDDCVRREKVFDIELSPPRVVRRVGWHRCLKCRRPFFSEDVLRLRLCSGTQGCRGDDDRFS